MRWGGRGAAGDEGGGRRPVVAGRSRSAESVTRFGDEPTGCVDGRRRRGRGIRRRAESSGGSEVEGGGDGLVEVGDGVGVRLGRVEGRCLIEEPWEEIALGRSASGREGRGFVGQVEVQEDGRDDRRIGQKREDPHLGAAGGTQERQ